MTNPIEAITGVTLEPSAVSGIVKVVVSEETAKENLSWDRFVRLKAAADASLLSQSISLLDAGGYDGALGLFLPGVNIDLIDPATTGGSILQIPAADRSYDVVTAVDVLEHIDPQNRQAALTELCRVARRRVVLNYPCQDSKDAQAL